MKTRNSTIGRFQAVGVALVITAVAMGTASGLVPAPGNVYYGLARDMFAQPLAPGSGAQVIMTRKDTTNEYTLAVSEILPITPGGPLINYILRPSLDDGLGARYSTDAARSNDVVQIYVVINGFRYAITNTPGCIQFSDSVPPVSGPGSLHAANIKANDDFDGDCLSDAWENLYYRDTSARPYDDDDGDGFSNLAEYLAGTNPLDPNSNPGNLGLMLRIVSFNGSLVTLDWPQFAAIPSTLLWSSNANTAFTAVPQNRLSGSYSNVVDVSGLGRLFFRVRYDFPQFLLSNPNTFPRNLRMIKQTSTAVTLDWPQYLEIPSSLEWSPVAKGGFTNIPPSRLSGGASNIVDTTGFTNMFFRIRYRFP
jgi:hypothetical protein